MKKQLSQDKLIIFDCDGVLVDSEIIAHRIISNALSLKGYTLSLEESIKKFNGVSSQSLKQIVFQESGIDISLDFISEQQTAITNAYEWELKPLLSEVLEMTQEEKICRCVASSSPLNRVIRSLEKTQQMDYFSLETIFTSQQVARGKPAPDLFIFASQQMGFCRENCLVIEDSYYGIQAAKSAGMSVIAFLGGTHTKFDWYHRALRAYNIPIAYDSNELLMILKALI